ncbi:MAG: hypothetical protein NZM37_07860 [Sandaracinaceae bacterium]|nr:hypothetical protein [Sandaracinaceae bacterium]
MTSHEERMLWIAWGIAWAAMRFGQLERLDGICGGRLEQLLVRIRSRLAEAGGIRYELLAEAMEKKAEMHRPDHRPDLGEALIQWLICEGPPAKGHRIPRELMYFLKRWSRRLASGMPKRGRLLPPERKKGN